MLPSPLYPRAAVDNAICGISARRRRCCAIACLLLSTSSSNDIPDREHISRQASLSQEALLAVTQQGLCFGMRPDSLDAMRAIVCSATFAKQCTLRHVVRG